MKKIGFFQEDVDKMSLMMENPNEFNAMKQHAKNKQELLENKTRIYAKDEFDDIVVRQIATVVFRFEMILSNADTQTLIRVKLYELLSTFLKLDQQPINEAFADQESLLSCIINDFDRFENNSVMLSILSRVVEDITLQGSCDLLTHQLYIDQDLLGFFAKKLSCSDYAKKKCERKDIYAFIHTITRKLVEITDDSFDVDGQVTLAVKNFRDKILPKLGPSFKALKKAADIDQAASEVEISDEQMNARLKEIEMKRAKQKPDKIVKHFSPEEESKMAQEENKSATSSPKEVTKTLQDAL